MNKKKFFATAISVVVVIFLIALATKNLINKDISTEKSPDTSVKTNPTKTNSTNLPKEELSQAAKDILEIKESDMVLGDKNAPITIIEYASMSCPHCAEFYSEGLNQLQENYIKTSKVNLVYRDFPLNQQALTAGMFAMCQANKIKDKEAMVQRYYELIKILFKTQDSWAFDENYKLKLQSIAKLDGVSNEAFQECIKNAQIEQSILKTKLEAAQGLNIESTPTFFIGDKVLKGYSSYNDIKNAIEDKLNEIETNKNKAETNLEDKTSPQKNSKVTSAPDQK